MLDPFEVLGLPARFDLAPEAIEERYRELSRVLHPDRHVGKPPAERRLALGKAVEVGTAVRVLRDPVARASALLRRGGITASERDEPQPDPEFLMEMLDLRETLSNARRTRNTGEIERLESRMRSSEKQALGALSEGFARFGRGVGQADQPELEGLLPLMAKLRYFRRFLDDVSAIQDELLTAQPLSDTSSA
jgi:molecular chaperone HscB